MPARKIDVTFLGGGSRRPLAAIGTTVTDEVHHVRIGGRTVADEPVEAVNERNLPARAAHIHLAADIGRRQGVPFDPPDPADQVVLPGPIVPPSGWRLASQPLPVADAYCSDQPPRSTVVVLRLNNST